MPCFARAFLFLKYIMALPYFYFEKIDADTLTLDEDVSKHITQVLRMKAGEALLVTDGKGTKAKAIITDDHRKRCVVKIERRETEKAATPTVCIAISLIKNAARFEWFLEKATEIGVSEIIPLLCDRTEKEKFRQDRLQNIVTSAMLQSQQCWMPKLQEPIPFQKLIEDDKYHQKFIAHCLENEKQSLHSILQPQSSIILIGPEGDFTQKEIALAIDHNYVPVTLGKTRLRTETAGIVAATLLCTLM
jgi:16S rRNA (uracil1498-N3)-methyltransferase